MFTSGAVGELIKIPKHMECWITSVTNVIGEVGIVTDPETETQSNEVMSPK